MTNLDFLEVADGDSADIEISFGGKEHKLRSVRCAFDNPKTLAHAFLPTLGDLHFNTKYFFEGERSLGDFLTRHCTRLVTRWDLITSIRKPR